LQPLGIGVAPELAEISSDQNRAVAGSENLDAHAQATIGDPRRVFNVTKIRIVAAIVGPLSAAAQRMATPWAYRAAALDLRRARRFRNCKEKMTSGHRRDRSQAGSTDQAPAVELDRVIPED
jgi:hypothetical protein